MDIELWSNCSVCSFADYTTASLAANSLNALELELETEAKKILRFMASNKLVANPSKTEAMFLCKSRDLSDETIKIGKTTIKALKVVNLLSMKLTADQSWWAHMKELNLKLSRAFAVIKRLAPRVSRSVHYSVVHGLAVSRIVYRLALFVKVKTSQNDQVWGGMRTIQTIINRIMKFMTHTKGAFHKLRWHFFRNFDPPPHVNSFSFLQ